MKRKFNWILPVLMGLMLFTYLFVWPWYRDRPAKAAADALIAELAEHGQQVERRAEALPVVPERPGEAEMAAQVKLLVAELSEAHSRGDGLIKRAQEVLPQTPGQKREQVRRGLEQYTARLKSALAAYNARCTLLREKLNGATTRGKAEPKDAANIGDDEPLHFHLQHPGGQSLPGDPNAAFCLEGTYHLHYILAHPWKDRTSFSFVHVTSTDLLHWTWQPTKLQPAFTSHGMFSGTGFLTKEGRPATIYHGEGSGRNQIAVAADNKLSAWDKPYPVDVREVDGSEAKVQHWDPDCFRVGDTYYSISGGENPPLFKSTDLKTWTRVGPFLRHDLPDVARGEDISCPNFFPMGDKWVLLCISHDLGCRYYVGDWDAEAEQFVPKSHGRMNWRREGQALFGRWSAWRADFFAPESVTTLDGRRVMWAWLATFDRRDHEMSRRTIQSLPRELSLPADGVLRIRPLKELVTLRRNPVAKTDVVVATVADLRSDSTPIGTPVAKLPGASAEVRVVVPREQAERRLFGLTLFADGKGGGLPVVFRPETQSIRVGKTEAPFSVVSLPPGEPVELRIFVDSYLVEVFVNDRQALVAAFDGWTGKPEVTAFSVGGPTTFSSVETWTLEPTNQGFHEAKKNKVWEPATK